MAGAAQKVKLGLSEARTLVLGAEILLGFQYEAIFLRGFADLSRTGKALVMIAFALLVLVLVAFIAPSSHHQIAERGEATGRQCAFAGAACTAGLPPFALAIGINVAAVTGPALGTAGAILLGAFAAALAFILWFGAPLMVRTRNRDEAAAGETLPLDKKIEELMTEIRIVLPGVQALLGFQFAAYLEDAFRHLTSVEVAAHTAALMLLVISMSLLMAPAPFNRLVDATEPTARSVRVAAVCMLGALAALALALALDFFVAVLFASHALAWALAAGLGTAALSLGVWFAFPWWRRDHRPPPPERLASR